MALFNCIAHIPLQWVGKYGGVVGFRVLSLAACRFVAE
jgi:hypothetical protein